MTTTETKTFASPTASTTSRKTYSPWAMKLAALLNERIRTDPAMRLCNIIIEHKVEREDVHGPTGEKKFYSVDVLLTTETGLDFGLEAMGDGSKSDDIQRHYFLLRHGIIPLYVANKDIDHAPHLVLREIRMKLKLLRLVAA